MKEYYICDENRIPLQLNDHISMYTCETPAQAAQKFFRKTKHNNFFVLNRTTQYCRQYQCCQEAIRTPSKHEIKHNIQVKTVCKRI